MRILQHAMYLVTILTFAMLMAIPSPFAQEAISLDREIAGELTQNQPAAEYTFNASRGDILEILWDIEERDFEIRLSLLDVLGNVVASSGGTNYPNFSGVYMQVEIPLNGSYTIRLEAFDFSESVPYTLLITEFPGDEQRRTIGLFESKSGIIGPNLDQDEFLIALRRGNPALFIVTTPKDILDSLVAVIDPQGNVADLNYDFFGSMSAVLFDPEVSGNYLIIVAGQYEGAAGPYTLVVNPVPIFSAPFTSLEEIVIPGDVFAFEVEVKESKTYEFMVTGVDDFRPFIVLMDANRNVIARNVPNTEIAVTSIPGFTPLQDETLYLYVMGETTKSVGPFQVDVTEVEDEENGIQLHLNSPFSGVIGPVDDVDEFVFSAEADQPYSILVDPTWHSLDPAVRITDQNDTEVFYNDNSANGLYSLLSNITFPAAGDYTLEISASPEQQNKLALTGVYVIEMATGTPFDQAPPRIVERNIQVESIAGGAQIQIPTNAIFDDTFPLSATLTLDHSGKEILFDILRDTPTELVVESPPDEVFFLVASDSADRHSASGVTLPPPSVIATLEGTPYGMAIDRQNNMYITDADIGGVYQVTIDGATKYVLLDQGSGGGTLGPNALAIDHEDNLYLSNGFMHSIVKFSPLGGTEVFAEGLNFPVDIAFDEEGVMYVAQIGSDTIDKIYPDGTIETLVTTIRNPNGLAFSPDGQLYVCNNDQENSAVYRIHEDGTAEPFVTQFAESLQGMAFDQDGYLYVADGILGLVFRISPDGDYRVFTRGLSGPVDLAFGYGDNAKTLFATNMGIEAAGLYPTQVIAIPTGRRGIPLPYGTVTDVESWMLY